MSTSSGSAAGVPSGMTTATTVSRGEGVLLEPTVPPPLRYKIGLFVSMLLFFVALLGPAIIGIGLKVQAIVPDAEKASALGLVAGVGALGALVANVVFGRLSDRTTLRWGRRRPWIVAGTAVMTVGLLVLALAPNLPTATVGWLVTQLGANATLAPFVATIADQAPKAQRASISALLGMAQNIGILGGTYVAELFMGNMIVMFVVPAVVSIAGMAVFAIVLPDRALPTAPPSMTLRQWAETFWVSPRRNPDYALAWWSRFLITLATFMFTTYRLFFLQDRLDLSEGQAVSAITVGVLVYTVALVASAWIAGKISDRIGRRKLFVFGSTALFAAGTVLLLFAHDLTTFYLVEVLLGFSYGIYVGVDLALVVDVLPNPDDAGKDLGVFNMANAMPQSIAPPLAAFLLGVGSATGQNYELMLWIAGLLALVGAFVVLPIKQVR